MNARETKIRWDGRGRTIVFALAASSIACLLADSNFYGACPMSFFTLFIFLPALIVLGLFAVFDLIRGDRRLWRAMVIGITGGLLSAVAYDIFRLPFVFAKEWGVAFVVPPLNLFKVFPRFGAMILGQPIEQTEYSTAAHLIGWAYHFSNGATFGVMYLAIIGDAARRRWFWAVVMALGLELGMLFTPYPNVFNISVSSLFVAVTLAAHLVFGIVLGLSSRWLACRWQT
jgi:hypothetical protein